METRQLSRIGDEKAQGVIESALVSMVLLLVLLGVVDFSRFAYYQTAIQSAARAGAEMASQHCAAPGQCGQSVTPVSASVVMWSTYCEGYPQIQLTPSYSQCKPGPTSTWTPTCSGTCTNCQNDICVSWNGGTAAEHSVVAVRVGYSFKPLSFVLSTFFPERSCWSTSDAAPFDSASASDDTAVTHHTICASSVGRVY